MDRVLKSETTQAKRTISVYLISATTGLPVPSLTFSGTEVMVNVNGGGWVNATGTLPEDGGSGLGQGFYTYQMTTGDVATAGSVKLLVNKAGCNLYAFETDVDDLVAENGSIAANVVGAIIEGSHTFGDMVRGIMSVVAGKVSDFTTGTLIYKSLDGTKTRFTTTTGSQGRLTVTPGDLT